MAGLVRNSGRSRAMPLFPLPDTTIGFWESMGQGVAGNFYLPGFGFFHINVQQYTEKYFAKKSSWSMYKNLCFLCEISLADFFGSI